MAKKSYQVASPIKHNGNDYEIDSSIELEDKEAVELRAVGAIKEASVKTINTLTAPADEAERIAAIVAAIGLLDKADTALWTNAGTPKTDGLTAITGWHVAGKERDAAWAQINTSK